MATVEGEQKAERRNQESRKAESRTQKAECRKQIEESRKPKAEQKAESDIRATLWRHLGNTMVATGKFSDAQGKLIGEVQEPLCASNVWAKTSSVSHEPPNKCNTVDVPHHQTRISTHRRQKQKFECCSDPAFTSTMTTMDAYYTRLPFLRRNNSSHVWERGGNHNMASSILLGLSRTCLGWNLCRTVICRLTCTFQDD